MVTAETRLQDISERMKRELDGGAAPSPERMTVRQLLGLLGRARRTRHNVNWVRHNLTKFDLRTVPDFEGIWVDATISIELDPETIKGITASDEPMEPTVRIGAIDAANREPVSVHPDKPLRVATTLMLINDYSQLPVMETEWKVKGVISWKSIGARISMGQDCQSVRDCMEAFVPEIPIGSPLFDSISHVVQYGYVLVRNEKNKIAGIVTSSDIAHQFTHLAGPFLIIGEIEGYLRSLVHGKFTVEELNESLSDSGVNHSISGPEELTLGGYCQLLGREKLWSRLPLPLDRNEFVKKLHWVREKRNDVMHFDPEGLDPEDVEKLENIAKLFRRLRRMSIV